MSWQQKGKNSILQLRTFGLLTVLRRRRQLLHSSSLLLFRYPVQLFKFRPSSQQYQQQQTCHQKWQWHNNYTSTFSRQNSNLPFPNNNTTKLHNQYKNICVKTITWPITTTRSVFTYSTTGRESNQNQKTTRIMNNSIQIKKEVNNTGTGKRAASTATTTPPLSNHITPIHELSVESTSALRDELYKDVKNRLAINACTKIDPLEVCVNRSGLEEVSHVFSHKVELEGKPMTNQKQSGRCWIFAFLNAVRVPFMKHLNIDEFEFSQTYLFFWDKLEKSNHFLNVVVEAYKNGEDPEGRLLSFLLKDPVSDGGQWDMLINLVEKYGLMPKKCFPESWSSESSARMNAMIRSKLREFAKDIYEVFQKNEGRVSDEACKDMIKEQMRDIHKIVSICLGIPKDKFTWEYYDKSKTYHKIGPITPVQFYEEHVRPVYDVQNKVCLIHDPRPKNEYNRLYSVQYLGNMTNGRPTIYNNQPIDLLKKLVVDSIKGGEIVWFGCEVMKRCAVKQGLEDLRIHDYNSVFGLDVSLTMTKADRLLFGESSMTHAMAITAVSLDGETDVPLKFRVENSWGDDRGEKGYLLMTSEWFDEFVFEIVVDKSRVSQEVLDVFNQKPVILPAWDPMGTLAF